MCGLLNKSLIDLKRSINPIRKDISNLSLIVDKISYKEPTSPLKKLLDETSGYGYQEARHSFKKMFLEMRQRRRKMQHRISWLDNSDVSIFE